MSPHRRAGLQDHEPLASGRQLSRSRQTDRPGTDDNDGQLTPCSRERLGTTSATARAGQKLVPSHGGILLPSTTFRKLSKCRLICQAPFRRVVAMRSKARLTDPMVGAVVALGITQITAWGTSFYCLGVLAG